MGADFISAALWRRGTSLAISDEEFAGVLDRVATLPRELLEKRLSDYFDVAKDEVEDDSGVVNDAEMEQVVRNRLAQDVKWLKDALAGGSRAVGGMTVGPYTVLLMGEMSWGDVDEGQESMWRLADSEVLAPLGFQRSGYRSTIEGQRESGYGTVISTLFEVIADRRECKVEQVVAAADAAEIYEDRMWMEYIGYAVDKVEDEISAFLPEYPA